jgi:hypothetical protein
VAKLIPVSEAEERLWQFLMDLALAAGSRWDDAVLLGGTMVRVHEVVHSGDARRVTRLSADIDFALLPEAELAAPQSFAEILSSLGLSPTTPPPDQVTFVRKFEDGSIDVQVDLVAASARDRFSELPQATEIGEYHRVVVAPGADIAVARSSIIELDVAGIGVVSVRLPDLESALITKLCNLRLDRPKHVQDLQDVETLLELIGDAVSELIDLLCDTEAGGWALEAMQLSFGPSGDARLRLAEAGFDEGELRARARTLMAQVDCEERHLGNSQRE